MAFLALAERTNFGVFVIGVGVVMLLGRCFSRHERLPLERGRSGYLMLLGRPSRSSLMYSVPIPQQPPTICAPLFTQPWASVR